MRAIRSQSSISMKGRTSREYIPIAELYYRLEEFAKEGYVIAAKLYHWAAGAQYAIDHPELFARLGKKGQ